MLNVQEVSAEGICQEVKQSKDSCSDVWAPGPVVDWRPSRQLHNEGDEVQGSGQSSVDQFLEMEKEDLSKTYLLVYESFFLP